MIFFSAFGINSILYQRGVYPPESFKREQKYGLSLFVTSDDGLNKYLNVVISQVKGVLMLLCCHLFKVQTKQYINMKPCML